MPRRPVSAHASAAKIAQQQRCTRGGSQGKCHSYSILKFQGHRPLLLRTSCSLWVVYVTPVLRTRCTGSSDSISARCLRVLYIHDFTRRAKTAAKSAHTFTSPFTGNTADKTGPETGREASLPGAVPLVLCVPRDTPELAQLAPVFCSCPCHIHAEAASMLPPCQPVARVAMGRNSSERAVLMQ